MVSLLVASGDPRGIRVIERSNWNGSGVVVPRPLLADASTRPDLGRCGVYVLWADDDLEPLPAVYIGESDDLSGRLANHLRSKDFWTDAVFFTSKDQVLNKAHVRYLESLLVEMASATKQCVLRNTTVPRLPSVSDADRAVAEGYLQRMLHCLELIGLDFFRLPEQGVSESCLFLRAKGVEARGYESADGFVVMEGSEVVADETASIPRGVRDRRRALTESGVIVDENGLRRFSQDYPFKSPSMAAGVVLGSSVNGRTAWVDEDGNCLADAI